MCVCVCVDECVRLCVYVRVHLWTYIYVKYASNKYIHFTLELLIVFEFISTTMKIDAKWGGGEGGGAKGGEGECPEFGELGGEICKITDWYI